MLIRKDRVTAMRHEDGKMRETTFSVSDDCTCSARAFLTTLAISRSCSYSDDLIAKYATVGCRKYKPA
jgi:hypothetical protein